ncbi:hypothetical protein FRC14_004033 [Serendipita sp. 396]|nr:hypothetical protein FRC14_004033 [Serendipita sp. 396]
MGQEQSGLQKGDYKGVARQGTLVSRSAHSRSRSMSEQTGANQHPATAPPPYSPIDPSPTVGIGTGANPFVGESNVQESPQQQQQPQPPRPLPRPHRASAGTNPFVDDARAREMLRQQQERLLRQEQPVKAPDPFGGAGANVRRGASVVTQTSPPVVNTVNAHRRYTSHTGFVETRQTSSVRNRASMPISQPAPVNTPASGYPSPVNTTSNRYAPPPNNPPTNSSPNNRATYNPRSPSRRASVEDPLLQLIKYDTVIIVDDSSSMAGPLWFEAREALSGLSDLAGKYDTDGIDVHFLNSSLVGNGLRNAQEVKRLFDSVVPDGITPTGEKLEALLLDYLLRLETAKQQADAGDPSALAAVKPVNYLVITDGAPSDDPETVIVTAARRLDAGKFPITQVGIQFVQIGSDPSAAEILRELDDDLAGRYGIRDIVDTTSYSGHQLDASTLTKCLLGGINRRVDRRGAS